MIFLFSPRRIVTLALCAGSFWLGMKTDAALRPAAPCEAGPPHGN